VVSTSEAKNVKLDICVRGDLQNKNDPTMEDIYSLTICINNNLQATDDRCFQTHTKESQAI
jgi:hypothetical protein